MGKHDALTPKKVSFLGSAGSIFGAFLLAGTIFAASQINGVAINPPQNNITKGDNGRVNEAGDSDSSGGDGDLASDNSNPENVASGPIPVGTRPVPATPGKAPTGPVRPSKSPPGTQPPAGGPQSPSPTEPNLEAHVKVPLLGLDVNADVGLGLLSVGVTDPVTETVNQILK